MGSGGSKATSKRKDTTSKGFLGRGRHTEDFVQIRVNEINGRAIGREIRKRCGNEGWHPYLDEVGRTTLRFLRAANTFIRDAEDDGADLENAAFILRQPGREFVIISGDGDWEYDFCEDDDGEIYGRCVRKPFLRYAWDNTKSMVTRVFSFLVGFLPIVGPTLQNALTAG